MLGVIGRFLLHGGIEVDLVVKLIKNTNSYEGPRAGDLRLEQVYAAQTADGN